MGIINGLPDLSFFGKGGKIGGTDLKEFKKGLFLEKLNNLVEEWGVFIRRKIS